MKAQAAQDIYRDKAVASNEAKIDMLSREVGALSDKFALKKELVVKDAATEKELAALKAAIDINTREIERLRAAERK
jgi:hypothetical protein